MNAPHPRPLFLPNSRAALGLVFLIFLAYLNSFGSFYLFDDGGAIIDNPTIRHFSTALSPLPNGTPVSGRPLVNFTFAVNYAISGLSVWSYHATNLAIHLLAALTLFGLVRRTLLLPSVSARIPDESREIAGIVAALWAVHPLQTESVTYLSQRAEEFMGLFYLLTFYAFVRSMENAVLRGTDQEFNHRRAPVAHVEDHLNRFWRAVSVAACLAGVASKEVMVSAPLLVLLYDRTFCAGTFWHALKQRPLYYTGLASTWLLLAWEMLQVGSRGGAVGPGLRIDSWHYALTQCHAVILYLWLCFWPNPLVFDYGTTTMTSPFLLVPEAMMLIVLLGVTAVQLKKRTATGFLCAWYFLILAPTSSIVPLAKQTIAEHRMYLPLAAVLMLVVLGIYSVLGRARLAAIFVAPLLVLTLMRNGEYLNGITIWSSSIARYPDNPRAHVNLGNAYVNSNQPQLAGEQYRTALKLDPNLPEAHNNLGVVEAGLGETAAARADYLEAMRLFPGWDKPHENLRELDAAPPPASK